MSAARERYERTDLTLSPEAKNWLRRHPFPGNVRELQNLIERSAILSRQDTIGVTELAWKSDKPAAHYSKFGPSSATLEEMEIRMIRAALSRNEGEITATARELGLTRAALYRRLEKYGIET